MVYRMRPSARYTINVFMILGVSLASAMHHLCLDESVGASRCTINVLRNSMVYHDTPSMSSRQRAACLAIPASHYQCLLVALVVLASAIRQLLLYRVILPRPVPYKEAFRYWRPCRKLAALLFQIKAIHLAREVQATSCDV